MKLSKIILPALTLTIFAFSFFINQSFALTRSDVEEARSESAEIKDRLNQTLKEHALIVAELKKLEKKFAADKKSLEEVDQKLGENIERLNEQIIFLYKERYSVLTLFLSSESIQDLATNLDFFARLTQQEAECIKALKQSQMETEERIETLKKDIDRQGTFTKQLKVLKVKLKAESRRPSG
ncbi:MAG: hypothetical protein Q8M92_09785, partial [Candidatus Subteraquimicrobiales bacterium]|nr:hypothetical protein [Candidatus Subteraquimicrobiales bacterium]